MTDLGSSNGTWVNGERIWASRRLRHGDEIRIGQTRLVFRDPLAAAGRGDRGRAGAAGADARERDVLVALCRPLLARDMFTEPASTRAIADELVITQAAVKQHLANLYDKFGVAPGDDHRRARLANEALRRGAVSLSELRPGEARVVPEQAGSPREHPASAARRAMGDRAWLPARRQGRFLPPGKPARRPCLGARSGLPTGHRIDGLRPMVGARRTGAGSTPSTAGTRSRPKE